MTKARELSELANLMSASGTTATVAGTLAATTLTGNGAGITGLYADSNVASYLAANAASNIAAEAVNEAKLQVSNSPTNGYMLTAQSAATGGMTWAAAPTSSTAFGAVGTYIHGRPANSSITYATNATASSLFAFPPAYQVGGNPHYADSDWSETTMGLEVSMSGTWRCMSGSIAYNNDGTGGLWVRIS